MLNRVKFLLLFIVIAVFNLNLAAFAKENIVIKDLIQDNINNLFVVNTKNIDSPIDYKTSQFVQPNRMVVDIQDAVLSGQKRSIDRPNEDINNVKIAQYSTDPNVVRLVFTAKSQEDLKKISLNQSENNIVFKINGKEVKTNSQAKKEGQNKIKNSVIRKINYTDDSLTISSEDQIDIKGPFKLQNPSRIVFDIPNSGLVSKDLQKMVILDEDAVRIAQYNPNTVRVVINTQDFDKYKIETSKDSKSVIIAQKDAGPKIQDIKVIKKSNNTTIVRLVSTEPITYSVNRLYYPDDSVNLELLNLNVPKKNLLDNITQTSQFSDVRVTGLDKYNNSSKWLFSINKETNVKSKLSADGKTLELTFRDYPVIFPSKRLKIVLDAGHGGSDPGANRVNIYEKNINLDVINRVKRYLNSANVDVILTRNSDTDVSLKARTDITNTEQPDAFVSVHVNSCASPNVKGLETHWYTNQSQGLAQQIQNNLVNSINSNNRGILRSRFYVIHWTNVPAVLVEIGFISNDNERADLLTEERQELTARSIANGILQFFGKNLAAMDVSSTDETYKDN